MKTLVEEAFEAISYLKKFDYILADTRVPSVSLYDHLLLTSGIAIALAKELLKRKNTPYEICGLEIDEETLLSLLRIAALFHDWGKEEGYKGHLKRSLAKAQEWLVAQGVEEIKANLILSGIKMHHTKPKRLENTFQRLIRLADAIASGGDRPQLAKAKDWEEFERLANPILELEQRLFGKPPLRVLFGDVDKVKSFVYETTALPEIRGASQILIELEKEKIKEILSHHNLPPECLIYSGGGSFLCILPDSLAQEIKEKIEKAYLERTKVASITIAISRPLGYTDFSRGLRPYFDEEIEALAGKVKEVGQWLFESHYGENKSHWLKVKGFGELAQELTIQVRRAKEQKEVHPFFPTLPIFQRCQSCGIRGATYYDNVKEQWLCSICFQKRKEGREEKKTFFAQFKDYVTKHYKQNIRAKLPEDLEKLSESSKRYMAFIYIDGNDIGALLREMKTPAAYRGFSETLDEAVKYSVFNSLYKNLSEILTEDKVAPFEIVHIGGDDAALIVSAHYAIPIAIDILKEFEKRMDRTAQKLAQQWEEEKKPITASCGMVICHHNYPVRFVERLADSLLKGAKKKAKAQGKIPKSALNYLYLTTHLAAEDAKPLIEEIYTRKEKNYKLTCRPYTLEEAERLRELAEEARKLLTPSQREKLAQALELGIYPSLNYLFFLAGREGKEKKKKVEEWLKKLKTTFGGDKLFIWKTDPEDKVFATPLLDLLEWADILGLGD